VLFCFYGFVCHQCIFKSENCCKFIKPPLFFQKIKRHLKNQVPSLRKLILDLLASVLYGQIIHHQILVGMQNVCIFGEDFSNLLLGKLFFFLVQGSRVCHRKQYIHIVIIIHDTLESYAFDFGNSFRKYEAYSLLIAV